MSMAPLPHEYMLVGIIGFFISVFWITSPTWSFALGLFSVIFVIASLISISGSPFDEGSLDIIAGKPYQKKKKKTLR